MIKNTVTSQKFCTTKKERLSYGAYFVGQNIFYVLISQYVMLFYTDYMYLSTTAVGFIFLAARIWDAVNDPLFGIIVDKTNLKGGKFKPWISISTLLIPVATILIFAMSGDMDMPMKIAYASVTYIIFGMLYTVSDVPIFALATVMTNNIQERTVIMSIGRLAATIAMIAASLAVMPIISAAGWFKGAILFSVVAFIVMIPINIYAKERFVKKEEKSTTIKEIFSSLMGNKYLLIFYLASIVMGVLNTAVPMSNYIAKYCLGGEDMIPILMLTTLVPMLVIAALLPTLTKYIDKFTIYVGGTILQIVFSIIGFFAGYENIPLFFILVTIRGIGLAATTITVFMFVSDCIEYGHYKTGKRSEGITFSIQTFSTKMIAAVSGATSAFIMTFIGYDGTAAVQSASTMEGLWVAFMLFPLIGLIGGLPILLAYKLRDKDVQVMALYNQNDITREEAEVKFSRKY